ncbi:MAG TPA: apolipoprotein N-acyltransferase [Caulobacteraceae bacterium]|nr:apolipoprotein N-acyltransferase [Caulobacteraceae bacterium]
MAEAGRGRSPWLARGAAVAAGALAALAQPPFGFLPGLLGYALLVTVLDRAALGERPLRSAFQRGWLAGVGYFAISLWWLTEPFQVDAPHQGWMAPFAVGIVTAGMALFWGVAAVAYRFAAPKGVGRVLQFAACFTLLEWLRGHVLTGFPWDLPGETWAAGSPISQVAAVVGAYGLTWITLAIAGAPAVIAEKWPGGAVVASALAVLAAAYAFGAERLAAMPRPDPHGPLLRVVQARVRQESKYDPAIFNSIVGRYIALTSAPAARRPDIVIWPEGAIPAAFEDYLAPGTWTQQAIVDALAPGETLILGGYRIGAGSATGPVAFNTLAVLRRQGDGLALIGRYDKFRLVPFGEFIPFDALAGRLGIKTFVHVGDGFTPGPRPRPLSPAGLPAFQPLICYEALYPGFTREGAIAAGKRPAWIVNISNDAWFGATSGPLQHLNIASYRAIEEGLPMVRATPTGVSAVIDAAGRPTASLGEGAYGIIDAPLPPALAPTPFSRWGDLPLLAMLVISLVPVGWSRRRA